ncbi:MAG: ABC transporter permease [Spirochaetia bacterium]
MRIFFIALKDLRIFLSSKATLILALGAPFLLTLGMGFIGGAFSSNEPGSGGGGVRLGFIDLDDSAATRGFFQGLLDAEGFLQVSRYETITDAQNAIEEETIDAAILIPEGFTNAVLEGDPEKTVTVFTDPGKEISADIAVSIGRNFTSRLKAASAGLRETAGWLRREQDISPAGAFQKASEIIPQVMGTGSGTVSRSQTESGETFNMLEYFAPGFAVLFLLLTVTAGTRSILDERREGTLARMRTAPVRWGAILSGKMAGVFITGFFQVSVILAATSLLFGLQWGPVTGALLLTAATSFACAGWGMIIAALAKTPAQVSGVGTSIMLIFGIMGGTFISVESFPSVLRAFSRITPNFWAIRGFTSLASGAEVSDILLNIGVLGLTGLVLLGISGVLFTMNRDAGKLG